MAKKVRRPNLPSETLERARRELQRAGELPEQTQPTAHAETARTPEMVVRAVSKTRGPADLRSEYTYVLADLKSMAVVAAMFMTVLVILSFFL